MKNDQGQSRKILLDLQKLNELNSMGYAGKFCLGDTVVLACGGANGCARYVLEKDAVFDQKTATYWMRNRHHEPLYS